MVGQLKANRTAVWKLDTWKILENQHKTYKYKNLDISKSKAFLDNSGSFLEDTQLLLIMIRTWTTGI